MKKVFCFLITLFVLTGFNFAEDNKRKKFELTLNVGSGFSQLNISSNYGRSFSCSDNYRNYIINESGSITTSSKRIFSCGASFTYYFSESIGIQTGFDNVWINFDTNSSYTTEGLSYYGDESEIGGGHIHIFPININGFVKLGNDKYTGYFSGGYTYFINNLQVNSGMGLGICATRNNSAVLDAMIMWVYIDNGWWNEHGMNIGGGFDYSIGKNTAITVDARYYYCPSKEFEWDFRPGHLYYKGFISNGLYEYDENWRQYLLDNLTSFEVNPSFFKISAGFKLLF